MQIIKKNVLNIDVYNIYIYLIIFTDVTDFCMYSFRWWVTSTKHVHTRKKNFVQ
jgi:hypothetical protein